MTGIRSWTPAVTAFGAVVRIDQASTAPGVLPEIPNPCESEQIAFVDFEIVRLFRLPDPLQLVERVRRNQAPAIFQRTRNAGFMRAVSDLALIIVAATDESLGHDGMSPSEQTRFPRQVVSDLGE